MKYFSQFILLQNFMFALNWRRSQGEDDGFNIPQERMLEGCCEGISRLWLFCQWVTVQEKIRQPQNDIRWFYDMIDVLSQPQNFSKNIANPIVRKEIMKFMSLLLYYQFPYDPLFNTIMIEDHFKHYFSNIQSREYIFSAVLTKTELIKILPHIIKKNKAILVGYKRAKYAGHCTAIFNNSYMDPNDGDEAYENYENLANKIFAAYNTIQRSEPTTLALCFRVHHFDSTELQGTYSNPIELVPDYGAYLSPPNSLGLHTFRGDISPLFLAAFYNDIAMANYCLNTLKLDPNQTFLNAGEDGRTPLHACCVTGNKEVAELLLAHGANPNCVDDNWENETPFFLACDKGHTEVVKLLLSCGANPMIGTLHGKFPIDVAKQHGYGQIVELLTQKGSKSSSAPSSSTPSSSAMMGAFWGVNGSGHKPFENSENWRLPGKSK